MKENKPLTLIEILNFEKELELLEKKIRLELTKEELRTKVFETLKIDRTQISHFKNGRRPWSVKRMLAVGRVIVGM